MNAIGIHCAICGEVEVPADELKLFICLVRPGVAQMVSAFYTVTCPGCHEFSARSCDERRVSLLRDYKVLMFTFHPPAELREPRPSGRLTLDDLIDLHHDIEAMA